ncbi:hypothetical protein J5N97_019575 [Dioscorea zingiberensis]|uniref:Auxin response factor n=1 Tax=Dioscorea zingiberensis TaxID=325984 RepID=A0A9D5CE45_9LILI|nr:hypothetical protein J5N97_019575 [Dioscorea zingiberensis]
MGIDLNTVDGDGEEEEEEESPLPAGSREHARGRSVCLELWHACAGPLAPLPRKGSLVVYLPQGHLEQLGARSTGSGPGTRIPPHVLCRVVDVHLLADAATDEVYARLALVAEEMDAEQEEEGGEKDGNGGCNSSVVPHMFCKTLTASDTSTHGGFSVPRRAAEDCFPPLDYKQLRPSQELVAKDLHGMEWRFRHIYRGQPRRHLLTTGWSAFVNKKKLASGDAVLFLRGNDGELRLGIRRAAQLKSCIPYSVLCGQSLNIRTFTALVDAVSSKNVFHIDYNPRSSLAEFVIPYSKFLNGFKNSFSVGMRFRLKYESDDATERRCTGLIAGIGDADPVRWPGSKWRCLLVRWDDDAVINRQDRVSPWEIEPIGSASGPNGLTASGLKRTRICPPSIQPDFPFPNGSAITDLGESARFPKVLQGQEMICLRTPRYGIDATSSQGSELRGHQFSDIRSGISSGASCMLASRANYVGVPINNSDTSFKCIGFGESMRFHKVLQGQEIYPGNPSQGGASVEAQMETDVFGLPKGVHPSDEGNRWTSPIHGYGTLLHQSKPSVQVSSPSSVLMFRQACMQFPNTRSIYGMNDQDEHCNYPGFFNCSELSTGDEPPVPSQSHTGGARIQSPTYFTEADLESNGNITRSSCRLFGIPLTKGIPRANEMPTPLSASPAPTDMNLSTFFSPSSLKC